MSDGEQGDVTSASRSHGKVDVLGPSLPAGRSDGKHSRLDESYRRVDRLAELADDWDSYGAAAPTPISLRAARSLLSALDRRLGHVPSLAIAPSHIAPLPSGGVQLEWAGLLREIEIEIEIGHDGALAYLIDDRSHGERRFTEAKGVPAATVIDVIANTLVA